MAITWSTGALPAGGFVSNCVWADTLSLFVAVGFRLAASTQDIWTSPDGVTWTARTSPRNDTIGWSSIAWNGTTLVAVGAHISTSANIIATSTDGITWTGRNSPDGTQNWVDVAWSPALSLWVAISNVTGTNKVITSPDGITWTNRTGVNGHPWSSVVWSPTLAVFAAVSGTAASAAAVMTSPDGINWTARVTPSTAIKYTSPRGIAWSPTLGIFVAPGTSDGGVTFTKVLSSSDGNTWSQTNSFPTAVTDPTSWVSVVWDSNQSQFIASGDAGTTQIATSSDGITWTSQNPGTNDAWVSGVFSAALNKVLFFDLNSNAVLIGALTSNPWWKLTLPDSTILYLQSALAPANWVLDYGIFSDGTYFPAGYSLAWAAAVQPSPKGWAYSLDAFSGQAYLVSTDSRPKDPRGFTEITAFATGSANVFGGFPGVATGFNNRIVYAPGSYTVGTDSPTLRIYDGLFDRPIATVPNTSTGGVPKGVMTTLTANGVVYFATFDSGTSSADWVGRVFSIDIESGKVTQVGNALTTGHLPYALCWHAGRLWCGSHRQSTAASGKVFYIRPGIDADWTADHDVTSEGMASVTALWSYHGTLYVGTSAAAGTFAKILARDTAGAYTTSLTLTGGTAAANNAILSMTTFGDCIYAGYFNADTPNISTIRKFDGSSWSVAYTGSGTTLVPFLALFSDRTTMFAIGGGVGKGLTVIKTTDGASWTDESAFVPNATSTGVPAFGVVVH